MENQVFKSVIKKNKGESQRDLIFQRQNTSRCLFFYSMYYLDLKISVQKLHRCLLSLF